MVHTVQLLKRGWNILLENGPVALVSRSGAFGRYLIESKYYGWGAKRKSPIEYHGVTLPLDMEIFDNRVRHAFITKSYEAAEVELIAEHVAGPYDVIDLGASTGFSTVYALNQLNRQSRGVAVEANPSMIDVINAVRKMNSADFEVEHAAYRPGEPEVTFHVHEKTVSGSTKKRGEQEITVSTVTLADIIKKYDIGEFVCLVDIEGGEIDLVRNELDTLTQNCKLIVVELHDFDGIAEEAKQRFVDSEFKLVASVGDVYVFRNESL